MQNTIIKYVFKVLDKNKSKNADNESDCNPNTNANGLEKKCEQNYPNDDCIMQVNDISEKKTDEMHSSK